MIEVFFEKYQSIILLPTKDEIEHQINEKQMIEIKTTDQHRVLHPDYNGQLTK